MTCSRYRASVPPYCEFAVMPSAPKSPNFRQNVRKSLILKKLKFKMLEKYMRTI